MKPNCPVCNDSEIEPYCYFEREKQEYVRCSNCNLIYISNIIPTDKLLKSYTGSWLKSFRRKLFSRFRTFENFGHFEAFMKKARRVTKLIDDCLTRQNNKIKLLDIGCNKGFLLASGIEKGWEVYGIELVPELLIPFKNKYKAFSNNLYSGKFIDVYTDLKKDYFDIVTAIDMIEHFETPLENLKYIYDIIKPGGILVIQTADSSSPLAKKMGCKWGALKPLEHLFIFNKQNYKEITKKTGFKETKTFEPFDEADGNFVAVSRK